MVGYILLLLLLFLLSVLSVPVRVSVRRTPKTQIYIRLLFFGIMLTTSGHNNNKKEAKRPSRRKRPTPWRALLRAVRYLLAHSVLHIDRLQLPRHAVPSSAALGMLLWGAGVLLGTVDASCERLLTQPAALRHTRELEGSVTVTFALLTGLVAARRFLSMYIKRKKTLWRKRI